MNKSKIIQLDPGAIQKADWIETRNELVEKMSKINAVDCDADFELAGGLQTQASKHLKALDKIRQAAKKPALDYGKDIDAQARELRSDLEECVTRVKKLNNEFATQKAREAERERQRIQEEAAQKALERETEGPKTFGGLIIDEPEDAPMVLPEVKAKTGSNVTVEVWEHEVVDPKLVPDQFKVVDESKIRAHVQYCKKMGMDPDIAGVRVIKRMDVRSK